MHLKAPSLLHTLRGAVRPLIKTKVWIALALSLALNMGGCATPVGIGDSFGLSPAWDWRTIETAHFRLTFPDTLYPVADRSGKYLEEAHSLLSPLLFWEPKHKVQVLVIDNGDMANGLASPTGRFGMIFYATPPENWFSTYYYDDWLRLLAIHEYTHYLNMDATTGYASALRFFFGDVYLPNSLWPSWMLEGLAVYMETRLTKAGRGRGPFYEMILRAAVEKDVLDKPEFVTLDRVNGDNPYFPAGETAYLFGYHLIHQISGERTSRGQISRDQVPKNQLARNDSPEIPGRSVNGELSLRSSGRIPYFINGNVENITGKDWHDHWNEWVAETKKRATAELQAIRSKPVTSFRRLTTDGRTTLGSAFSPDGKWVAFTQEKPDAQMSLWIAQRDEREPVIQPVAIGRKLMGGSLAFTADSKAVVFSSVRRNSHYTLYSDLAVHDLESGSTNWLTDGARAKDPDVSPDGKSIVYTIARDSGIGIAIARIDSARIGSKDDEGGTYRLRDSRIVLMPDPSSPYDAINTPKFTRDGKSIVFTLHKNGYASEELMMLEIATGKQRTILADGAFNRFPAVHPDGSIYFVSDASGVDNIYRVSPASQAAPIPVTPVTPVTNVTTGLWFPSFDPSGKLHANIFSYTGWDLAEIDVLDSAAPSASTEAVRIPPVPAPADPADPAEQRPPSGAIEETSPYPAQDYSIFPSIWPRQWAPLVLVKPGGVFAGGEVVGFDAIDRHRYLGILAYDGEIKKPDSIIYYANRSLVPTLGLTFENRTSSSQYGQFGQHGAQTELVGYTRKARYQGAISYPFLWTFSTLNSSFAVSAERLSYYGVDSSGSANLVTQSLYVPTLDWSLSYFSAQSSALAITSEKGRSAAAGARLYLGLDRPIWKFLLKDSENILLGDHAVLIPSFKASWVTSTTHYSGSYVNVQAPSGGVIFGPFSSDSLDQLGIRGYPNQLFFAKSEEALAVDFRFPLWRIFRGMGTHPVYLDYLYGFTFAELNYFPRGEPGARALPSAGGGLRLQSKFLLNIPVLFSLEYHHGFAKAAGGAGETLFFMGMGNQGL